MVNKVSRDGAEKYHPGIFYWRKAVTKPVIREWMNGGVGDAVRTLGMVQGITPYKTNATK